MKRSNRVTEKVNARNDVRRLHEVSVYRGGRTAVVSYGVEQV